MAGRKRSGFHNHWKAYLFHKGCPSFTSPPLPSPSPSPSPSPLPTPKITYITLSDIATYNSTTHFWVLNKNTIITQYQILIMPVDDGTNYLDIDNLTLQNDGVISYDKTAGNVVSFSIQNNGYFLNNGSMEIGNSDVHTYNSGMFINYGTVTNGAYFYCENLGQIKNYGNFNNKGYVDIFYICDNYGSMINLIGTININQYGVLTNYNGATIRNEITISNSNGTINNKGYILNIDTIYNSNSGTIINNSGGEIINDGAINNSDNGVITNNGVIINNYVMTNADGTSFCGSSTINGSNPIQGNPVTPGCP